MDSLVIVDCQNDFISGTLACEGAEAAVKYLVSFMREHKVRAAYTADWHSAKNGSFREIGGVWPPHCVAGTAGADISSVFYEEAPEGEKPVAANIFRKGKADDVEEYSAFRGETDSGVKLADAVTAHVWGGGIASEYCVRETVLDLLAAGHTVTLLVKGLAWVSAEDHRKNLADLKERGVTLFEE